ncbi:L,D-transpeptidase family protein [Sphingomonas sp.]|uniref:L,D-transpeptidase family protein n=1 Tax=Sphingomonas sp. TaxID=28214 RepID=UPI002ED7EA25
MRHARIPVAFAAVLLCAAAGGAATAQRARVADARMGPVATAIRAEAGGDLRKFYAARNYRPLWAATGRIGPEAATLLGYLRSARLDGLDPADYDVDGLRQSIAAARTPQQIARAELALSAAFARYVRDQREPGDAEMTFADKKLRPGKLSEETVLRAAAFPKNFTAYVAGMGWMSEHYVRLRALMKRARDDGATRATLDRLALNLDRARLLPGPAVRHIVVDASSGRLWYYQAGKQVGTMRVVVGAPETQTPMLAGMLQWAVLNPYWNVPDYLVRDDVAPKVLAGRSLSSLKMEALDGWGSNAAKIPSASIDWSAVAAGRRIPRVRELPWAGNSMGKAKFLFPNKLGIYLHDTPKRDLLKKENRHFSNGCIRLEDAATLGRWLLQRPLRAPSKAPEQAVALPVQVPVYLTYLTATPTKKGIGFRKDVYGRDG